MLMLDLCAGLKGASQAMSERGWRVITLDIDPKFQPDIIADVTTWSWQGERPDLVWASPPCDEFAREFFPWSHTGQIPNIDIVKGCRRIIAESLPRFWVIENVRGAVPYLGRPSAVYYPYYLWGFFPPLGKLRIVRRHKEDYSSRQKAERGRIPFALSLALAIAVESQGAMELRHAVKF